MSTWLLVPAPRSRVDELRASLSGWRVDRKHVVIITTVPAPIEQHQIDDLAGVVLLFDRSDMVFGEWLNLGLDHIAGHALAESPYPYEVLAVSSDCYGTPADVDVMRTTLRDRNLGMVGPDLTRTVAAGEVRESHGAVGRNVYNRVHGSCFMVAGELGLRFDPQFRWWFSDDDFEMQHRITHGVATIGGMSVTHQDSPPGALQQQHATEDLPKFVAKHGVRPW